MDPGRRGPRPVGTQTVDIARRERLVGRSAVTTLQAAAALACRPPHPFGPREDEQLLGRTVSGAHPGREPEHVADGERRLLEPAQSAPREPGDDSDLGLRRAGDDRERSGDRHRHSRERIADLAAR